MASVLRRLSTSSTKAPDDTITSRRESPAGSTDLDTRTLCARDYKLAISPEDSQERRLSVASTIVDQVSGDEPSIDDSSVTLHEGRIYGARDYKLIPRRTSQ